MSDYYENQILQTKRWPAIHICEAVAASPRHVIVGGVRASSRVRHLLRAIPSWLKRYVMCVEGTKIKSTTVISDEVTDHHLPAYQLYCLTIGSYVFHGWTEEEVHGFGGCEKSRASGEVGPMRVIHVGAS